MTGKTEGWQPGETSRLDADRAVRRFLLDRGTRSADAINQIPMVFTTGGIGMLTPHVVVYTRTRGEPSSDSAGRLAMGVARSELVRPEWLASTQLIEANVKAIRAGAQDAGIDPSAIEYVVGKAYYPTQQDFTEARAAGYGKRKVRPAAGVGTVERVSRVLVFKALRDALATPDGECEFVELMAVLRELRVPACPRYAKFPHQLEDCVQTV